MWWLGGLISAWIWKISTDLQIPTLKWPLVVGGSTPLISANLFLNVKCHELESLLTGDYKSCKTVWNIRRRLWVTHEYFYKFENKNDFLLFKPALMCLVKLQLHNLVYSSKTNLSVQLLFYVRNIVIMVIRNQYGLLVREQKFSSNHWFVGLQVKRHHGLLNQATFAAAVVN